MQNNTGRAWSIPAGLVLGAAVSMGATVIISFIGAQMILNEIMPQEQIGYCAMAALLTGAILGASIAAGRIKHRKRLICLLNGCVYCAVLLAATALFFGGQYEGIGVTIVTTLLGSAAAAVVTNSKATQKGKHKRRK